jgi:hypothetical protein
VKRDDSSRDGRLRMSQRSYARLRAIGTGAGPCAHGDRRHMPGDMPDTAPAARLSTRWGKDGDAVVTAPFNRLV